jgi:hypothetical protein
VKVHLEWSKCNVNLLLICMIKMCDFFPQLTEEEKEKVDRRREQNRLAAQRFRQKQKLTGARVQKVRLVPVYSTLDSII